MTGNRRIKRRAVSFTARACLRATRRTRGARTPASARRARVARFAPTARRHVTPSRRAPRAAPCMTIIHAIKGGVAEVLDAPPAARLTTAARIARLVATHAVGQLAYVPFAVRALATAPTHRDVRYSDASARATADIFVPSTPPPRAAAPSPSSSTAAPGPRAISGSWRPRRPRWRARGWSSPRSTTRCGPRGASRRPWPTRARPSHTFERPRPTMGGTARA